MFFSCKINKAGKPADIDKIEGLATSKEWTVISSPYAAYRAGTSFSSDVIANGRQGDICEVKGKKLEVSERGTVIWYYSDEGWLSENDVLLCTNKMQADKASSDMLK
ncbi:MAG: hypothetical protein K5930_13745 [Treponemataceae bacterium]|nr:hypothetical protein [Treponemataceae bacterium]